MTMLPREPLTHEEHERQLKLERNVIIGVIGVACVVIVYLVYVLVTMSSGSG